MDNDNFYLNPRIFSPIADDQGQVIAYATHDIAKFMKKNGLTTLPQRIIGENHSLRTVHRLIEPDIPVLYTEEFDHLEEAVREELEDYLNELQTYYNLQDDLQQFVPCQEVLVEKTIADYLRRMKSPLYEENIPDCFVVRGKRTDGDIDFRYVTRLQDPPQTFYVSSCKYEPPPSLNDLEKMEFVPVIPIPEEVHFEDLPEKPINNILGFNDFTLEDLARDEIKLHKHYEL